MAFHTCQTNFPAHPSPSAIHRLGFLQTAIAPRRGKWRMSSTGSGLQEFAARCLVPHQFQLSFIPHFAPHHSVLTSDLAISVRVPRSMETLGRPSKMDDGQPRPLEIAPVQPFIFIIIAIAVGRRFDFGNVPLDADQSDSYTSHIASANEIFNTYILFHA